MRAFTRLVPMLVVLGMAAAISAAPGDEATATPGSGSGNVSATVPLNDGDIRARTDVISTQMKVDYRHVLSVKEKAEKQKDVVKVTCVNDKLVLIKAQLQLADTTSSQLQAALENNSSDKASLFTSYSSTGDEVHRLSEDANSCLGGPDLFKQESGIEVDEPDITDDPTGIDPYNPGGDVTVEPPGYASPFH